MLRKVASDQGTVVLDLIRELTAGLSGSATKQIASAAERFKSATQSLLERGKTQPELLSWVANDYLDLTGYLLYAFMWDKMEAALDAAKHSEDFIQSKQLKAKFYYSRVLPRIESLFSLIEQFPSELSSAEPKLF
nr:acyl-CoA dehydrogenase C-terminal domain-containing protein [Rheinheimera soli]